MLDINTVMKSLAMRRPFFHSEADFRLGLASHLCNTSGGRIVRLEHKLATNEEKSVDIWFPSEGVVIELVHRLQRLEDTHLGVSYDLKYHKACDQGRFEFVKSIQLMERTVSRIGRVKHGFSVLLTNDPEYWADPRSGWQGKYDADFRTHEGNTLSGALSWDPDAKDGTTRGEWTPIELRNLYSLKWQHYSDCGTGEFSRFRYLAVEIGK